jgi:hypothetical protein
VIKVLKNYLQNYGILILLEVNINFNCMHDE